ncbi:jg285 [Pararge aegeria aegeria]|uniref:Jg285 protein n=1 Tax=Pararge aegeria aegeria TaxID=348720 RepID=A0A8S4QRL6_9NEOP|nr:jg285 [Pararge aegeria aegeria]
MELKERAVLLILFLIAPVNSLPYDIHWLSGPTTIERDFDHLKRTVDIYCYTGTPKDLFTLWQTVKVS